MSPTDPLVQAIVAGVLEGILAVKPAERLPRLMDVDAAARYLSRSPNAVRKLIDAGKLPSVRIDRKVCLDVRDLDRVIEEAKNISL